MGKAKLTGLDKQIIELSGKDGDLIKTETTNLTADQAADLYHKMLG